MVYRFTQTVKEKDCDSASAEIWFRKSASTIDVYCMKKKIEFFVIYNVVKYVNYFHAITMEISLYSFN